MKEWIKKHKGAVIASIAGMVVALFLLFRGRGSSSPSGAILQATPMGGGSSNSEGQNESGSSSADRSWMESWMSGMKDMMGGLKSSIDNLSTKVTTSSSAPVTSPAAPSNSNPVSNATKANPSVGSSYSGTGFWGYSQQEVKQIQNNIMQNIANTTGKTVQGIKPVDAAASSNKFIEQTLSLVTAAKTDYAAATSNKEKKYQNQTANEARANLASALKGNSDYKVSWTGKPGYQTLTVTDKSGQKKVI